MGRDGKGEEGLGWLRVGYSLDSVVNGRKLAPLFSGVPLLIKALTMS